MLMSECESLEMRSRRKMLLLHGIPKAKNKDTIQVVLNAKSQYPGMPALKEDDISCVYRIGRVSRKKPRPLVIKFCSQVLRDRVRFSKIEFKGSGFILFEFLTRKRHCLFMKAGQKLGVAKNRSKN